MKFSAVLALTSAAAVQAIGYCSPGQYRCSPDSSGIDVCDAEHKFVYIGPCNEGETCKLIGDLPFCVVDTVAKRTEQCTPGVYQCTPDGTGIDICDSTGSIVNVGPCAKGETCEVLKNGLPYCVDA